VEITPAGREFVAVAERMLNDLKLTSRSLGEIASEQRGRISVATYSAFANQSFPVLAKHFLTTRPAVELQLKEGLQWDILEHVRSGSADFGVGLVDAVSDPFSAEPLFLDPLWVALPAGHPLTKTKRASVGLHELKGEPLVTVPTDTHVRRSLESSAGAAGFALKYAMVVAQFPTMLSHVQAGVGPAILPLSVLPAKPWREFEAYPLVEPKLVLRVGIITLQGRYLSPATAALVSLIRDRCRDAAPAA
jgi:DNA-binding transcriptional LysR family regulator